MVDTYPALFWGYTFFFIVGIVYVILLSLRLKKVEKQLRELDDSTNKALR